MRNPKPRAFDALKDYVLSIGAELLSYHHIEPAASWLQDDAEAPQFTLQSHGFPEAWVEHYVHSDYRRIDPITAFASYQTRPVLWSDVPHRVVLNETQHAYLGDLYRWLSPGDGLAVPLFGPSGRNGYGGIGWRKPIAPWDAVKRRAVQSIFESFHLRICELRLSQLEQDFVLTREQHAVLRDMNASYTDWDIADRMGMSVEAVRKLIATTLTRMRVTDPPVRPAARAGVGDGGPELSPKRAERSPE